MNKTKLKSFAPQARNRLREQIAAQALRYGIDFIGEEIVEIDSVEVRAKAPQIAQLKARIHATSFDETLEEIAYTWFNRFIALRFMEVNGYLKTRPLSSSGGYTLPDILSEAQSGTLDQGMEIDHERLLAYLSENRLEEAYKLLMVSLFNQLHASMPYMFEQIDDYTELLMPEGLLSEHSITRMIVEGVDEEDWKDVQIIGWLYQFYISEKKDDVFAKLKKNQKITEANIPAATQLFTPHWIVRYMVENTLGKVWMLNNPDSTLKEHMPYYIETDDELEDYPVVRSPEELTFIDPCAGSGHTLVYAFDLLMKIYEERMYDTRDAVEHILTKNLFGLEIDDRAAALANYALAMRAMHYYPRFLRRLKLTPNVLAMQNLTVSEDDLREYAQKIGSSLITAELIENMELFRDAKTFGSLIAPTVANVDDILQSLEQKDLGSNLFLEETHREVLQIVKLMRYLQKEYTVTVTNPPYMGSKGMNKTLSTFVKKHYPDSKSDLFACFMERCLTFTEEHGFMGMINQHSWMFLSSYEKLRKKIIEHHHIDTLVHLGPRAFEEIGGEVVQSVAFVVQKDAI
ncbi:MAG: BREX-1 system adenine-specific DNA-methyltransferase PglX [Sulfurovum sp.]|nr:BREX-1 system adenine-specific DNA-methyltransferase PglX [Sulfurovum sp.]